MEKKVILVFGNFNIVHPGHLRLLRYAKSLKGELQVAVAGDSIAIPSCPVPDTLRLEAVEAISYVDKAFIYNEPIDNLLNRIKPSVVVKGKEYEEQNNDELSIIESYGGKLVFGSGEVSFSSIDLLRKEMLSNVEQSLNIPIKYIERQSMKVSKLNKIIKAFSEKNVCVIGDLIMDEYITCEPLGMSQEDPTIVVQPLNSNIFVGGAGIVASHSSGLGATTHLLTIVGDDGKKKNISEEFKKNNVDASLIIDDSRPTTLKQRYRAKGKSLLRVSHLSQNSISLEIQKKILSRLKKIINRLDVIIFSDFNYGVLPQNLVEEITALAKGKDILLAADSQSSSQTGDISRFVNMDLLTPTEREARISLRDNQSGIVRLVEKLTHIANPQNIFLKLGEEGMLVNSQDLNTAGDWTTDRLQALNSSPKDVAGAGDSMLITGALALSSGANIWEAALLGSIAAGIQVGRIGNTPLQQAEIVQQVERISG